MVNKKTYRLSKAGALVSLFFILVLFSCGSKGKEWASVNDVVLTESDALLLMDHLGYHSDSKEDRKKFTEEWIERQVFIQELEKENPEFANVMDEYRDGLLLFDLMEKEIWNKAKTDTLGLKAFYEKNIANYQWHPRVEANVFSSTQQDAIQQTLKFLKKKKSIDFIKEQLNKDNKVSIMVKTGVFEEGSEALPKYPKLNVGISDVIKDGNYYFVIDVLKKMPKGPKTFEETKGKVINDYQQYLESKWVDELKKEFTINIDKGVFSEVKQELQQ